jgi:hypothetical protein
VYALYLLNEWITRGVVGGRGRRNKKHIKINLKWKKIRNDGLKGVT